jgi:mannose/fructose/N-acetylgalactosamine-specific phosphotransferase system component IID
LQAYGRSVFIVGLQIKTISNILFRSLFIQGAWTFKNMQYIGFIFSITPGIRALQKINPQINTKLGSKYFNTQPYMAPTAEGIYLNLVENGNLSDVARVLPSVSSALAALGDSFFWAALKPILCLLCLISGLANWLWGILIVILIYNVIHFWIMGWGFWQGYRNGPNGALSVGRAISIERSGMVSLLIPFLCGACLVVAPGSLKAEYYMAIPAFVISVVAFYKKMDFLLIFYGFFILILIMTIIIR